MYEVLGLRSKGLRKGKFSNEGADIQPVGEPDLFNCKAVASFEIGKPTILTSLHL